MSHVHITAHAAIHDGMTDAFKDTASKIVATVREAEPDTLQYLWYLSDDGRSGTMCEVYRDSAAIMAHLGSVGPMLGSLLDTCDLTLEVCGDVSEEVSEALGGLDPAYFRYLDGVDRLS